MAKKKAYQISIESTPYLDSTPVTVEDNTLVILNNGKRQHEDRGEEDYNCTGLEKKAPQKLMRTFRLPKNCNVSSITTKCENGVLTVTIEKLPPPPKSNTVEVTIA